MSLALASQSQRLLDKRLPKADAASAHLFNQRRDRLNLPRLLCANQHAQRADDGQFQTLRVSPTKAFVNENEVGALLQGQRNCFRFSAVQITQQIRLTRIAQRNGANVGSCPQFRRADSIPTQ